jgi:hypothetical protein
MLLGGQCLAREDTAEATVIGWGKGLGVVTGSRTEP